jgi:hypothetical protein
VRELLNKYGKIIVPSVLVLAVVLYLAIGRKAKPVTGNTSLAFFVDEETGVESSRPVTELPPLVGSSGKPTVVRAIKYSCDGGKTVTTAYWSKYTEAAQAALKSLPEEDEKRSMIGNQGELVRSPQKGSQWVHINSAEGRKISEIPTCPSGEAPIFISPK